ncbi:hypothetical protein RDV84_05980 [Lysobacter yananisis]|uniref:Uncharacterized protein n=1 Tax=Lysobacter yananisis TaxID=1003114 RepID=A0ABY9PBF0_9GAMM|nr:hypothetical protein [Lysobacter yananisis]WMT04383.1 hypothetical protein RDV84_05980 [Lysobacter yananisis]
MLTTAVLLAAAGCGPDPAPAETVPTLPAQAVTQLVSDLRRNDLAGYARHAVPPELHQRLEQAWSQGRTVWPLTELPLDDRFASFIAALAEQDAERKLVATYRRQFAGADTELQSAAKTLGLFASQYVRSEPGYSETERDHHAQLIEALSGWAQTAPLGDSQRAREAIPQLVSAARATGLAGPDGFAKAGMDRSLRRLGPFAERLKQVLGQYGLGLDAALDSVDASLAEQTGDTARVRVRYQLAGQPVDAYVLVERIDGRWYLSDVLRHARAEAEATSKPAPSATMAQRLAALAKVQARAPSAVPAKPAAAPAPAAPAEAPARAAPGIAPGAATEELKPVGAASPAAAEVRPEAASKAAGARPAERALPEGKPAEARPSAVDGRIGAGAKPAAGEAKSAAAGKSFPAEAKPASRPAAKPTAATGEPPKPR